MEHKLSENSVHPIKGWIASSKVCLFCGTQYWGWDCHKYCSNCTEAARRRKPPVEMVCGNCGATFLKPYKHGYAGIKFCPACREGGNAVIKAHPRACKQCGKTFRPGRTRQGAELCSRFCQGTWINAQGLGPKHNDEELLARLVKSIVSVPYCMSQQQLTAETGVAHKTLSSRKWTMAYLYSEAGVPYTKPSLASKLEDSVFSVLTSAFPGVEIFTQHKLPGMLGVKGGDLRADFFVPSLNLMVEADGNQHRDSRGGQYPTEYIQANDRNKDAYAKKHGIRLVRIPQSMVRSSMRKKLLEAVTPLPWETSAANPFNCWKGGESLPISSQAPRGEGSTTRPKGRRLKRAETGGTQ